MGTCKGAAALRPLEGPLVPRLPGMKGRILGLPGPRLKPPETPELGLLPLLGGVTVSTVGLSVNKNKRKIETEFLKNFVRNTFILLKI